ncbi:hypothetical protein BV898_13580 [Hypsibius exemplaris]|uniref:Uncharacterized protein n=1 Tax=Hypsibius exemplaris TaxID=2072580 RepID=A0A1W0WAI3_HYPEX|nr:hypothetical protein BV898_13580 [Hypsibius exemplaris]
MSSDFVIGHVFVVFLLVIRRMAAIVAGSVLTYYDEEETNGNLLHAIKFKFCSDDLQNNRLDIALKYASFSKPVNGSPAQT